MNCRACGHADLFLVHAAVDRGHSNSWDGTPDFHRCLFCGSDTSTQPDPDVLVEYGGYAHRFDEPSDDGIQRDYSYLVLDHRNNCETFERHARACPDRTFLDVGHCEGAGLTAMQNRGWSVHGFDVFPDADLGPHTTIAPVFAANLFPRRFSAILCREVIEHVAGWRYMLWEASAALLPGGLLQVQTPRPWPDRSAVAYQRGHLCVFSPLFLRTAVTETGLRVLEHQTWPEGQLVLARR